MSQKVHLVFFQGGGGVFHPSEGRTSKRAEERLTVRKKGPGHFHSWVPFFSGVEKRRDVFASASAPMKGKRVRGEEIHRVSLSQLSRKAYAL